MGCRTFKEIRNMDTQHCLQCEFHKDRVDQDGWKYCYCFFNPDKGRWVAEIENCPKLGKHHGSSEIPKDLEEKSEIPINVDLDKEIDKRYEQARVMGYVDGVGEIVMDKEPFTRIARHFYELGRNAK